MATTPQPSTLFPELEQEPEEAQWPDWKAIEYPSSDGLQLMGTSWHEVAVHLAREALDRHYRGRKDLFIAVGMALYYERGEESSCLIPDLMVAFGVPGHGRRLFRIWEERQVPQVVLEVASRKTKDRDCKFKKEEYERLGVREYWQLDQRGDLLNQPLIGHRLRRGRYERIKPSGIRDGSYEFWSRQLRLLLRTKTYRDGLTIAFRERTTGRDILTGEDMDRAFRAVEQRATVAEEREASERRARLAAEDRTATERQARLAAEDRTATERQARLAAEDRTATERQARLAAEDRTATERQARLAAERHSRRAEERAKIAEESNRILKERLRAAEQRTAGERQ